MLQPHTATLSQPPYRSSTHLRSPNSKNLLRLQPWLLSAAAERQTDCLSVVWNPCWCSRVAFLAYPCVAWAMQGGKSQPLCCKGTHQRQVWCFQHTALQPYPMPCFKGTEESRIHKSFSVLKCFFPLLCGSVHSQSYAKAGMKPNRSITCCCSSQGTPLLRTDKLF